MLKSMTGYGSARSETSSYAIEAEIRTVNNRSLKINLRSPELFSRNQRQFEELVKTKLSRGTVDISIRLQHTGAKSEYVFHLPVIEGYLRQFEEIKKQTGLEGEVDLQTLLALPGAVDSATVIDDEDLAEQLRTAGLEAASLALDELTRMRLKEGEAQQLTFLEMLGAIEQMVARVEQRRPHLLQEYRERLQARVQELLNGSGIQLKEEDLIREIAIFAERSDIAEELQRLQSHVNQFREALESAEPVGRKLEFITQEMHREVNTMGAKSNDAELGVLIVDLKGIVEQIKEQTANVE